MKLKSKQEEIFEVEKEVACRSVTVKNMVEDTGLDTPVPLPMVDSKILIKARARGLLSRQPASPPPAPPALPSGPHHDLWMPHPRSLRSVQVIEYCKYHHRAEGESIAEDEKNVSNQTDSSAKAATSSRSARS